MCCCNSGLSGSSGFCEGESFIKLDQSMWKIGSGPTGYFLGTKAIDTMSDLGLIQPFSNILSRQTIFALVSKKCFPTNYLVYFFAMDKTFQLLHWNYCWFPGFSYFHSLEKCHYFHLTVVDIWHYLSVIDWYTTCFCLLDCSVKTLELEVGFGKIRNWDKWKIYQF